MSVKGALAWSYLKKSEESDGEEHLELLFSFSSSFLFESS